jgi:hypothetical protein
VSQDARRLALIALALLAATTACGGSSAAATPSSTTPALATPTVTPAPRACPTAAMVGAALGITLPKPTGVSNSGTGPPLPSGATGFACDYHAATYNVIIELITNIDPSYIAQFSNNFPVAFTPVSGVGDQARSFSVSIGSGRDNEGVVATKGRNLVAIVATATPATLGQLEALVNKLL